MKNVFVAIFVCLFTLSSSAFAEIEKESASAPKTSFRALTQYCEASDNPVLVFGCGAGHRAVTASRGPHKHDARAFSIDAGFHYKGASVSPNLVGSVLDPGLLAQLPEDAFTRILYEHVGVCVLSDCVCDVCEEKRDKNTLTMSDHEGRRALTLEPTLAALKSGGVLEIMGGIGAEKVYWDNEEEVSALLETIQMYLGFKTLADLKPYVDINLVTIDVGEEWAKSLWPGDVYMGMDWVKMNPKGGHYVHLKITKP